MIYIVTGLVFLGEGAFDLKIGLRTLVVLSCLINIFIKRRTTDILALTVTVLVLVYFILIRF